MQAVFRCIITSFLTLWNVIDLLCCCSDQDLRAQEQQGPARETAAAAAIEHVSKPQFNAQEDDQLDISGPPPTGVAAAGSSEDNAEAAAPAAADKPDPQIPIVRRLMQLDPQQVQQMTEVAQQRNIARQQFSQAMAEATGKTNSALFILQVQQAASDMHSVFLKQLTNVLLTVKLWNLCYPTCQRWISRQQSPYKKA